MSSVFNKGKVTRAKFVKDDEVVNMTMEHDDESYYASEDEDNEQGDGEISFKSSQQTSDGNGETTLDEDTETEEHYYTKGYSNDVTKI